MCWLLRDAVLIIQKFIVMLLRWLLAWNQNKHVTYCMHISYTGLEITIDLSYDSIGLLPENKHN